MDETMVNDVAETADEGLLDETTEVTEDNSESLESIVDGSSEQSTQDEQTSDSQGTRQEPGYVKARIEKAVAKAVAATEARMQANFEKQMAPYREQMIAMEAQELVRKGQVKDLETAKELVRYRQGQPQTSVLEAESQQPRNAQGQFAAKEQQTSDPVTAARIDMLQHQADRIRANGGPDVIGEFKTNAEIQKKVISGELDFYEVAELMNAPKKKTPSPMRSPNGASGAEKTAISNMSREQFAKLNKKLDEGVRYSLR